MKNSRHEEMRQQCIAFHRKHPEVFRRFCQLSLNIIDRGFEHYGAQTVWEALRWETDLRDGRERRFALNNNYVAFYARAFMRLYPEHDGFFRLREQKSAYQPATGLDELGPDDFPEARE